MARDQCQIPRSNWASATAAIFVVLLAATLLSCSEPDQQQRAVQRGAPQYPAHVEQLVGLLTVPTIKVQEGEPMSDTHIEFLSEHVQSGVSQQELDAVGLTHEDLLDLLVWLRGQHLNYPGGAKHGSPYLASADNDLVRIAWYASTLTTHVDFPRIPGTDHYLVVEPLVRIACGVRSMGWFAIQDPEFRDDLSYLHGLKHAEHILNDMGIEQCVVLVDGELELRTWQERAAEVRAGLVARGCPPDVLELVETTPHWASFDQ